MRALAELELSRDELVSALERLSADQREALETAAQRVKSYHQHQLLQGWHYEEQAPELAGTLLGQKVTPLDRVGLYVPGGKAAYPSSVLMNAIPAKVAGVGELVMVVPTPGGDRNPLVLAAAALAGVDRVFCIGGAQAVGALAYGTQTIPRVDKIVGPGNAYVAAAKRRVFGIVGIDMVAGPSEILVICDGNTDPDWVAMDLFSQAEHDELAQSILLCPDASFIDKVSASIERLLPAMPRKEIIRAALENRGALIQVRDLDEACAIANRIAPEHLELSLDDADAWVPKIRNAGAIFIGPYTSESLGDYCAGPNHVLPTSGSARFSLPAGRLRFSETQQPDSCISRRIESPWSGGAYPGRWGGLVRARAFPPQCDWTTDTHGCALRSATICIPSSFVASTKLLVPISALCRIACRKGLAAFAHPCLTSQKK